MVSLFVVVLTGLLFLLVLVSLGFQPKINAKLSGWLLFFTAVSGACNAWVVRCLLPVCRFFYL